MSEPDASDQFQLYENVSSPVKPGEIEITLHKLLGLHKASCLHTPLSPEGGQ